MGEEQREGSNPKLYAVVRMRFTHVRVKTVHSMEVKSEPVDNNMKFVACQSYKEAVDTAGELLILKKFDQCLCFCWQCINEAKTYPENRSAVNAVEALCIIAIQAYAELNRWQEVLPFITQLYNGIEDCPEKVVHLCVLLHAHVRDYTTCNAVSHIWLRNPSNLSKSGYCELVEIFVKEVLVPQEKWDDVTTFVDGCTAMTEERKRLCKNFVRNLQKRRKELETVDLEEASVTSEESSCTDGKQVKKQEKTGGKLGDISKGLGSWVSRYIPLTNLRTLRNLALITVVFYVMITRANLRKYNLLPYGTLYSLWNAVMGLWRSMFAPYHMAKAV